MLQARTRTSDGALREKFERGVAGTEDRRRVSRSSPPRRLMRAALLTSGQVRYRLLLKEGAGLKATVVLALIFKAAPVCGLRPCRAALWRSTKAPKPG